MDKILKFINPEHISVKLTDEQVSDIQKQIADNAEFAVIYDGDKVLHLFKVSQIIHIGPVQ